MKPKVFFWLVILLMFVVSACNVITVPSEDRIIISLAIIEGIELLILESFPVQVHVRAKGILSDSCTTLDRISQRREGDLFKIRITTRRPADAICADIITRFEKMIALDVYGLPAGTYTVDVNGVRDTFTLIVDNVIR